MNKKRCKYCNKYDKQGHNYCRMCGYEFKPGFVKNVRKALVYAIGEKYCGYCGKLRENCKC